MCSSSEDSTHFENTLLHYFSNCCKKLICVILQCRGQTSPSVCFVTLHQVTGCFCCIFCWHCPHFQGSSANFPPGTRASSANLVDAVVYGDSNLLLLDLLTPGQSHVNYSVSIGMRPFLNLLVPTS